MKNLARFTAALLLLPAPALAADASGSDALALAARVGILSPALTRGEKALLSRFLDGRAKAGRRLPVFAVRADAVECRASDVDITEHDCALSFGDRTLLLKGREAQALYATLADSGIMPGGAAGSMVRTVARLDCSIDPDAIGERAGGGAQCSFMSGE